MQYPKIAIIVNKNRIDRRKDGVPFKIIDSHILFYENRIKISK